MQDDPRSRILNSAGPIFAELGFQAATVRAICRAAGVNSASVNYYFGDKLRLYIETVKRARQLRMQQVPMPTLDRQTPAATRLRIYVHTMLLRMTGVGEELWQSRLLIREFLNPSGACQEVVEQHFRPEFELLLGILAELLPGPVSPHVRQRLAFSVIGQCLFYRVAREAVALLIPAADRETQYSLEVLADHITGVTLGAVERPERVPGVLAGHVSGAAE
jgi:TetR/AcrR family transcriptional regulator, regulator of cefoperazone and chloramphenicol sensitivity